MTYWAPDHFASLSLIGNSGDRRAPRDSSLGFDITKRIAGWRSPQEQQMDIRKDHSHDLDKIIEHMNNGHVGKFAGHLLVKAHFEKHHFSMTDVDKHGNPRPVDSQLAKWQQHHPMGKRAHEAIKNALDDTFAEKEAALKALPRDLEEHERATRETRGREDTDDAHERQRAELGGGAGAGEYLHATKRGVDKWGTPLAASNGANRELNKLADKLVALAKRDKVTMTHARAVSEIAGTDRGKVLMQMDRIFRGIDPRM
jgi:hypothetical protein